MSDEAPPDDFCYLDADAVRVHILGGKAALGGDYVFRCVRVDRDGGAYFQLIQLARRT